MKQPSGEQQALSGRRSIRDAGSGVMQFGHAVLKIRCQHTRQAAAGIVNLKLSSLLLGRADLAHIHIVHTGPKTSGMRMGRIGAAGPLDVGPDLDHFPIRPTALMVTPLGEGRDLFGYFDDRSTVHAMALPPSQA